MKSMKNGTEELDAMWNKEETIPEEVSTVSTEMMKAREEYVRRLLRIWRTRTTKLAQLILDQCAFYNEFPAELANDIATGKMHKAALTYFDSRYVYTEQSLATTMRDAYSPQEVLYMVIAPLYYIHLTHIERLFIKNRWALPKWDRPAWLSDPKTIEAADYIIKNFPLKPLFTIGEVDE